MYVFMARPSTVHLNPTSLSPVSRLHCSAHAQGRECSYGRAHRGLESPGCQGALRWPRHLLPSWVSTTTCVSITGTYWPEAILNGLSECPPGLCSAASTFILGVCIFNGKLLWMVVLKAERPNLSLVVAAQFFPKLICALVISLCLAFYNLAVQEVKMRDSADFKQVLLQMFP